MYMAVNRICLIEVYVSGKSLEKLKYRSHLAANFYLGAVEHYRHQPWKLRSWPQRHLLSVTLLMSMFTFLMLDA